MAIPTWEGVASAQGTGTSASVNIATIDGGSPPSVDDLLFATVLVDGSSATTNEHIQAPDGWHRVNNAHNSGRDAMFWKIRESGDSNTVQFDWVPSDEYIADIHCIRGVDLVQPIARYSAHHNTATSWVWLAETTPVADCLALATAGMTTDDRAGSGTPGGWTKRFDVEEGTALTRLVYTQGFATKGTSTGALNQDIPDLGSDTYVARMVVFQPPQPTTTKNIEIAAGDFLSPTVTGDQDFNVGFDVKALIIWTTRRNNNGTDVDLEYSHGIGADDGITAAAQRSYGYWHDSGTSDERGYSANGEIVKHYNTGTTAVGSPDLAAVYSKITDGFRLNWSAVEGASGRRFQYIAIGGYNCRAVCGAEQASTSPVSGLPWRPQLTHVIGQCLNSDSDQMRTAAIGCAGWLDHQSGGQWCMPVDIGAGSTGNFRFRDSGFYAQVDTGSLTYECQFEQTNDDGWGWVGSNTDQFFYLALNFGDDTVFPFDVEILQGDDSGVNGTDQTLPVFADGATKQVINVIASGSDSTAVGTAAGSMSNGWANDAFSGAGDQDVVAIAKTGNVSERYRQNDLTVVAGSSGDLDTPTKEGAFTDADTIDWQVNDTTGILMGLCTIGQGAAAPVYNGPTVRSSVEATVASGTTLTFSQPAGLAVGDMLHAWVAAHSPSSDVNTRAIWQSPQSGDEGGDGWIPSNEGPTEPDGFESASVRHFWKFATADDVSSWDGAFLYSQTEQLQGVMVAVEGVNSKNPFVTGEDFGVADLWAFAPDSSIECPERGIAENDTLALAFCAGAVTTDTAVDDCTDGLGPYTVEVDTGEGSADGCLVAIASREWANDVGSKTEPVFNGVSPTPGSTRSKLLHLRGGTERGTLPDVWVECGSFVAPTATGNFDVDLVGRGANGADDTKAVLFWGIGNKNDGGAASAHLEWFFGFATPTEGRVMKLWAENGSADVFRGQHESNCIEMNLVNNNGAGTMAATLVSSLTDGFRLNFSAVENPGFVVNFMAIGGADASADIVQYDNATTPIFTQATAVDPELVFTFTTGQTDGNSNDGGNFVGSIGCFNDRGGEFHTVLGIEQSSSDGGGTLRPMGNSAQYDPGGVTLTWETRFIEANPGEMSLNVRQGDNTDETYALVLNLSGLRTLVREMKTFAGADDTDVDMGLPFPAQAMMLHAHRSTYPQIGDRNMRFSLGAYDGTTQIAAGVYAQDSATNRDQRHFNNRIAGVGDDMDPTVNGLEIEMVDLDTGTFVEAGGTNPLGLIVFEGEADDDVLPLPVFVGGSF